ncbi:hypothetical protein ACEU0C_002563 [Stenotrophomonas indicatrix]|uniref:hypothetical protein n=1 Tax=Stenotrophomonas indicatrix TaxID=2045451 RepID=UPI000FB3A202|nr:hypothetical protein [Stenotrophomonas indicatrix]
MPSKDFVRLVVSVQPNADQFHPESNLAAPNKRKQNAITGGELGWRARKRIFLVLHNLKDGVFTRSENDHLASLALSPM